MNISTFRKNLKDCFDATIRGEKVVIERSGQLFELITSNEYDAVKPELRYEIGGPDKFREFRSAQRPPELKPNPELSVGDLVGGDFIRKIDAIEDVPKKVGVNLCKVHDTPLTAYGKCLMKGCKYA